MSDNFNRSLLHPAPESGRTADTALEAKAATPRGATPTEQALWQRILEHDFEPDTPLNFTKRLARDHGWTMGEARAAIHGYRHFCFLAMVTPTPVTPSEAVDEVWHQHLTYSRDYWVDWCGEVLGKPLHHDPTAGGPDQQALFRRQYAETLALLERYFGPPDPILWPATHERFGQAPRYQIIDTQRIATFERPIAWIRRMLQRT